MTKAASNIVDFAAGTNEEIERIKQLEVFKHKTHKERFLSIQDYEVDDSAGKGRRGIQKHAMAVMKMMRENETDYFKVMAKGVDNLFLLDQVIDTIARWIYVEEIISEPMEE